MKNSKRIQSTVRTVSRILLFAVLLSSSARGNTNSVIVVVGAPGADEYAEQFAEWAQRWADACDASKTPCVTIGVSPIDGNHTDRDKLKHAIDLRGDKEGRLWIVMIGHGTPFGQAAKFNLRGPDLSSEELAAWLQNHSNRIALVNCTSASGPFLQALSGKDRVVVTATKSGAEINYARFGYYLSQAIGDRNADLDHDDQVSLLEAFLTASKNVQRFYEQEGRLATEHALIDDNADRLGTPADFFEGIRATKSAKNGSKLDGPAAHQMILLKSERESKLSEKQIADRDLLETELEKLRQRKSDLPIEEYYKQLEPIMLQLAKIYADEPASDVPSQL